MKRMREGEKQLVLSTPQWRKMAGYGTSGYRWRIFIGPQYLHLFPPDERRPEWVYQMGGPAGSRSTYHTLPPSVETLEDAKREALLCLDVCLREKVKKINQRRQTIRAALAPLEEAKDIEDLRAEKK